MDGYEREHTGRNTDQAHAIPTRHTRFRQDTQDTRDTDKQTDTQTYKTERGMNEETRCADRDRER